MNKKQEALDFLVEYSLGCAVTNHKDDTIKVINKYKQTLQELVDKQENFEQENFELGQKLNTEEECCVMLKKKVKKQVEIIISLCKALQENGSEVSDLSYLIFSYLTPEEWEYCKELLNE